MASKHLTGDLREAVGSLPSIRLDSPVEAAKLIKASSSLGLSSGILLGINVFHFEITFVF